MLVQSARVLALAALAAAAAVPASATATTPAIVTGPSPATKVKIFDPVGAPLGAQTPYTAGVVTGVRVAMGDVNADGADDFATAPRAGVARVKVYVGRTPVRALYAYGAGYSGGVNIALGDVTGDGRADIVTGPRGALGPNVRVYDGATGALVRSFFAYDAGYQGGVTVAAGDVDGDGRADIITGTQSGAGHVKAFSGATNTVIRSFLAYDATFTGGVNVAAGDVDGDGRADIVTAPVSGAGPNVKAFNGATGALLRSFFADSPSYTDGLDVAAADLNADGRAEIVTGRGPGLSAVK